MKKGLLKILLLIVLVFAGFWLLKQTLFPSLKHLFTAKEVTIDETPILIKEVRSMGQLVTATAYDEVVVDSVRITRSAAVINAINRFVPLLPSADQRLVLIGKGKVLAGIDLTLLQDDDLKISGDTVRIQLPRVRVLEAIMNPSDFETFEEKGEWKPQAVTALKIKARQKMVQRAHENRILDKAGTKAKAVIQNFFESAGYKVVEVNI